MKTVGEFIRELQQFPSEWPVYVATKAGGEIAIEHRDVKGKSVIAVFGSNGGRFGENPLTEEEYEKESEKFMRMWNDTCYSYTSDHGDHRMYLHSELNGTCYGVHFDRRIVERMVDDGLIPDNRVDIERVRMCED